MRWLGPLILVCLSGCSKGEETIAVPVSACQRAGTGQTKTDMVQTGTICVSYDKSGLCTVPVPQYGTITSNLVRYDCAFSRWE